MGRGTKFNILHAFNRIEERRNKMFNFNTSARQKQLDTDELAIGAKGGSAETERADLQQMQSDNDDYVNSRINELEAQRREFMAKKPDFDMKLEMQNPQFAAYVMKNRLSVEDAYFLVHRDEVIGDAVKEMMDRITQRRGRIVENGAGKNSPASVKKNPGDMSDKEIDAIIERVQNGEKVSF